MTVSSIQAALGALVTQIGALVVGFGVINNTEDGLIINVVIGAIGVAFLIAHSIHATAAAKVKAANVTASLPPAPSARASRK